MPTEATAGNAPPTDENMVSEHMDEELHGGDSPVPNSIGMAVLMGGYNAVDAAKMQALAFDCDDGDMVFMNISPTQFKTIVEELSNDLHGRRASLQRTSYYARPDEQEDSTRDCRRMGTCI